MFHQFKLSNTESGLDFDITLDPGKRLYCFIGENGVGKTSLLETMGQTVWWLHAMWRGASGNVGQSFQGLYLQTIVQNTLKDHVIRVPNGSIGGQSLKDNENWTNTFLINIRKTQKSAIESIDRPFIFVPSGSRTSIDGIGPAALQIVGDIYTTFASTIDRCLRAVSRESIDAANVSMWIASRLLINPNFIVGFHNPYQQVVALLQLLQEFDPKHFNNVLMTKENKLHIDISYHNGQLLLMDRPIDRLPSGYIALIKILQEIVASIADWEAIRGASDVLNSDALIFIDEIDAHLHPKWQQNLLPFLKRSFPNATFVVTTHSPLVVRDTEAGEAYELLKEGNTVTARKLGSPKDWYMADVLSEGFHVNVPLPGTAIGDDGQSLVDQLLDFSTYVRNFSTSKNPSDRDAALKLYDALLPKLLEDDPRRRSILSLRELLG